MIEFIKMFESDFKMDHFDLEVPKNFQDLENLIKKLKENEKSADMECRVNFQFKRKSENNFLRETYCSL